ncbi:YbbR-like domain-containing protein [Oceanobacillus sp. J11TS1]|uniref:CdaR family protein n=1 Tax=Oceanobacillus sp. J11TS1 TaxID=2807191 RepID=UPI001B13BEE2|nr:CdaR family protein [Oceanobacillus sp. J11TS1]GIO24780.1 cell surface protein [Oceanobacillus sp. J11TS1]
MDNWFKSKWFVRILSLAFAVTLYAFVSVSETPNSDATFSRGTSQTESLDDVPVDIRIDRDKYVVSDVPEGVQVSLKGTPGSVTPLLLQRNFDVYVDLEDLEEGTHVVELQHNIASDVEVFIEPKTIEVTIEERASQEFAVTADFINQDLMADGYEVVSYSIEPEVVTIMSSRSVIESIGAVKVYVNLDNVDGSINNRELPVNVYDLQGNELDVGLDPESIQVSVEVDKSKKTVPLSVETTGELDEDLELGSVSANEEEVEIYSQSDVLDDISEVTTEPLDLSEIEESGTVEVPLDLPENVQAPDTEDVEVSIEVEGTKVIEDVSLEEEGLADGLEVSYTEPTFNVELAGDTSVINDLTAKDIRAILDLSGLETGNHKVPITIEVSGSDEVTATSSVEEITVEIIDPTVTAEE